MTMTGPALKNLNVISSTEKTPTVTRDQLHQAVENHQHHHCHQQQQQQQQTETLQTLNLKSLKTLNTTSSKDKSPAVMHDPRAAENRHRLHHNQQQQLQQERQQNATSKNWNDPDSTVQQLVTGNTSAAGLPAQTRSRRLPPATNNSLLQSPLGTYKTLHRTPTVGDGPPKSEGKMSMSMTGPMQDSSSNYVASTLPRTIKFQTNGDVRQQRPQHPVFPQTQSGTVRLRTNGEACQQRQQQQQPSHFQAGVHVHQTPYINRLNPDWLRGGNHPMSKFKDVVIKDRVQFFTRNELAAAAAAAANMSAVENREKTTPKTSWLRRALFKWVNEWVKVRAGKPLSF